MRYLNILFVILGMMFFQSCSEDELMSSEPYHTFAPEAWDMSEEAQLRRDFFEQNGFYILFNDTLRHTQVGEDGKGKPVYQTETVDPNWSLFGYDGNTKYKFAYFKTIEEKKLRAEFVTKLAKSMAKHNLMRPYSVLVVDTILSETSGTISRPDFLNSLRCFILAASDMEKLDEMKLLSNIAGASISSKYDGELQPFYNMTVGTWGDLLYGTFKWGFGEEMEPFYELGLLVNNTSSMFHCSKEEDVTAYIHLLLTKSEEDVMKEFASYEKVLKKYALIKDVATKADIRF
ncbi:MAG: hypothetical protein ACLTSL_14495 [Odoribacter splanchnicus]